MGVTCKYLYNTLGAPYNGRNRIEIIGDIK